MYIEKNNTYNCNIYTYLWYNNEMWIEKDVEPLCHYHIMAKGFFFLLYIYIKKIIDLIIH